MVRGRAVVLRLTLASLGTAAAVAAAAAAPADAHAAFTQAWPAFALVAGLLLVGAAAAADGIFEAAGAWIARAPGGPVVLLCGLLLLDAAVTVVLNLDTAVVFMTPVLLHAARRRLLGEGPFLYGAVFMANSASLLLPGANLTNLIVFADRDVTGSLSAIFWLQVARANGARPSIRRYSAFGVLLVPLTLCASLLVTKV